MWLTRITDSRTHLSHLSNLNKYIIVTTHGLHEIQTMGNWGVFIVSISSVPNASKTGFPLEGILLRPKSRKVSISSNNAKSSKTNSFSKSLLSTVTQYPAGPFKEAQCHTPKRTKSKTPIP
jgi:hypothetical protein